MNCGTAVSRTAQPATAVLVTSSYPQPRDNQPMDEQTFKDISWLFQKLGEHLAKIAEDPPPGADTRKLLKHIIDNHQPTFSNGRNPFNWLKELNSTLNFWAHLDPTADLTEDEIWRDLHTLELVSRHLNLPVEFVD